MNGARSRGASAGTANKLRAVLRAALPELAKEGTIVSRNMAADARPSNGDKKPELYGLMGAFEGRTLQGYFSLLAATCLREGEALGLLWEDIDFESAEIRVQATLAQGLDRNGSGRSGPAPRTM